MPLIPIDLPKGMYKNGTPYGRKGRWSDGNLVRWHDGSIRPIGGWARRTDNTGTDIPLLIADPTLEAVRDMYAWTDLAQDNQTVFGSNIALYNLSQTGTVTDITPVGYVGGGKDAAVQAGYGENPYGLGNYGAANNLIGQKPIPPERWYFTTFGEILITGVRNNTDMFELDLNTLTLSVVTNAPTQVQDAIVTDERQVFTIGGGGQPRRIQTSDNEDRNTWTPATDNQCIDRTLSGTGRLLRTIKVQRQILIIGENDAHVATYIEPPYVYSINLVGQNCGPLAAEAIAATDRFAVWWGDRNFWLYDGSIQILPCDVIDFLYDDINPNQVSKTTTFSNTNFSEVWWLYQSNSSTTTEVDSYVVWNYQSNSWVTGRLDRTTGFDKGVLATPIMVSSDGAIYLHELDDVLADGNVFVESGAIDFAHGEHNVAVRYIYPDNENANDVTFELIMRQFPNASEYTYGPYNYNNPVPTRALGRSGKVKVNFQSADSELGLLRLDVSGSGTGKR